MKEPRMYPTQEIMSNVFVGNERLTWRQLALRQEEEIRQLNRFASMVFDLDRNENGRHEGDADTSDPTGRSRGNPRLQTGDILGYSIHGTHVYRMPPYGQRHDPAAWLHTAPERG